MLERTIRRRSGGFRARCKVSRLAHTTAVNEPVGTRTPDKEDQGVVVKGRDLAVMRETVPGVSAIVESRRVAIIDHAFYRNRSILGLRAAAGVLPTRGAGAQ